MLLKRAFNITILFRVSQLLSTDFLIQFIGTILDMTVVNLKFQNWIWSSCETKIFDFTSDSNTVSNGPSGSFVLLKFWDKTSQTQISSPPSLHLHYYHDKKSTSYRTATKKDHLQTGLLERAQRPLYSTRYVHFSLSEIFSLPSGATVNFLKNNF